MLAWRYVPESRAEKRPDSFDFAGAVTVTAGLIVLVYAIVKAEEFGWGSTKTIGLGALAIALLAVFVLIERRSSAPLVRLGIFRIRSLLGANLVLLVVAGGLFANFFFSSLYVQQILGYTPLEAGLAFLPVTVGIVAGSGLVADPGEEDRRARDDDRRHGAGRRRPVPARRGPRSTAPTSARCCRACC